METTFVREVSLRYKGRKRKGFSFISGPSKAAEFVRGVLLDNVREHFVALFLSQSHCVAGYSIVSTGTASACPVHIREVFQPAIMAGACALIAAHNHPSGSIQPSEQDRNLTKRLKEAGDLLGIPLLDHVIVTDWEYFSFSDERILG